MMMGPPKAAAWKDWINFSERLWLKREIVHQKFVAEFGENQSILNPETELGSLVKAHIDKIVLAYKDVPDNRTEEAIELIAQDETISAETAQRTLEVVGKIPYPREVAQHVAFQAMITGKLSIALIKNCPYLDFPGELSVEKFFDDLISGAIRPGPAMQKPPEPTAG